MGVVYICAERRSGEGDWNGKSPKPRGVSAVRHVAGCCHEEEIRLEITRRWPSPISSRRCVFVFQTLGAIDRSTPTMPQAGPARDPRLCLPDSGPGFVQGVRDDRARPNDHTLNSQVFLRSIEDFLSRRVDTPPSAAQFPGSPSLLNHGSSRRPFPPPTSRCHRDETHPGCPTRRTDIHHHGLGSIRCHLCAP